VIESIESWIRTRLDGVIPALEPLLN